jgi:DNA polymerase I-like protein with 3'-5' exonuclease and polymerase domains
MEEVENMRALYFERFRGVGALIELRHHEWRRDGYIDTPYFFRRWMGPEYEPGRKTNWDNISMNSPIQGTAHMLMLIALHILAKQPNRYKLLAGVSMEVHDALVFKTAVRHLAEVYGMVQDLLEKKTVAYTKAFFRYNIDVPIVAEGGVGFRYGVELETPDFSKGLAHVLLAWVFKNLETEAGLAGEFGYDAPAWY